MAWRDRDAAHASVRENFASPLHAWPHVIALPAGCRAPAVRQAPALPRGNVILALPAALPALPGIAAITGVRARRAPGADLTDLPGPVFRSPSG
jgi:hypothetical protein